MQIAQMEGGKKYSLLLQLVLFRGEQKDIFFSTFLGNDANIDGSKSSLTT